MVDVRAHQPETASDRLGRDRPGSAIICSRRINGLGLEVLVRPGEGVRDAAKWSPRSVAVGAVQNIVATLPGTDREAPAVLVMSHYDTVPNSPGAADDSAASPPPWRSPAP